MVLSAHSISEASASPLIWIGRLGGGVRQTVLANRVGIEGASLVRLLDQLEGMGLVVRRDDPTDRRAKGLWLTDEGAALVAEIEAVVDGVRGSILKNITKADLEAAVRVLNAFDDVDPTQLARLSQQFETTP